MKKRGLFLIIIAAFGLSCAHHRDVRPGPEGIHRVIFSTDDMDKGHRKAIDEANHFCKERNQVAAFISDDNKYTGSMDEQDYKTAKNISKAAQVVGGGVWATGRSRRASRVGGVVGTGGFVGDKVLGNAYTIDMQFKCQ